MMKKLSQQNQVKLHDMLIDMQHEFGVSVIASVCCRCGSDKFYISPNGDIICVTCDYRYELVMTISTSIRPPKEPKKEDSDD